MARRASARSARRTASRHACCSRRPENDPFGRSEIDPPSSWLSYDFLVGFGKTAGVPAGLRLGGSKSERRYHLPASVSVLHRNCARRQRQRRMRRREVCRLQAGISRQPREPGSAASPPMPPTRANHQIARQLQGNARLRRWPRGAGQRLRPREACCPRTTHSTKGYEPGDGCATIRPRSLVAICRPRRRVGDDADWLASREDDCR